MRFHYRSSFCLIPWTLGAILCASLLGQGQDRFLESTPELPHRATVIVAHNAGATKKFQINKDAVREMMRQGLKETSGAETEADAWKKWIGPDDTVGVKVYSSPGRLSGSRPEVVSALVQSMLDAGIAPGRIVIWDKHLASLQNAGFDALADRFGVKLRGAFESGFDENVYYENEILGELVWGDLAYGSKETTQSRRSYLSKLITQELTKFVLVTPLMNHNSAGVAGHLWSLALGSADNLRRFERDPHRLSIAVPELFAMKEMGDRVALCVTDALLCQYQGEAVGLLHYSSAINQLRFSVDPVALDVLSLEELERQRLLAGMEKAFQNLPLYRNAALLEIGVYQKTDINVVYLP